MRYQGRVVQWNDARGFGFVETNGGGPRVFLHISELSRRGRRPVVGELVTYEIENDAKGRPQARSVAYVGDASEARGSNSGALVPILLMGILLLAAGYVAWVWLSHPNSTLPSSVYKVVFARDALRSNPAFRCAPEKSSCSAMTSCAEAFFHQERCGISTMDGDHDGIPCESQWCR